MACSQLLKFAPAFFVLVCVLNPVSGSALPERLLNHSEWSEWKEQLGELRTVLELRGMTVLLFAQGRVSLAANPESAPVLTLASEEEAALERAMAIASQSTVQSQPIPEERVRLLSRGSNPAASLTGHAPSLLPTDSGMARSGDLRMVRSWDGQFHLGTPDGENFIPFRPLVEGLPLPLDFQQDTRPVIRLNSD